MPPSRRGKWNGRLNMRQIEDLAGQKIAEFQRRLKEAGLTIPEIPPVPAEYIALTITELSVRGVRSLTHDGRSLSGLLDTEQAEILYDEEENQGRQGFTIAHELGHYFLHYLPEVEAVRQPTLFDGLEFPQSGSGLLERAGKPAGRYFRCSELALNTTSADEEGEEIVPTTSTKIGRRALDDPDSKAQLAKIIRLKELATRIEWEANVFARGLLMPRDLVRWLNKKHAGDVPAMATELGVSQTAMRYRLNNLNLRQDADKGLGAAYGFKNPDPHDPQQGTFF